MLATPSDRRKRCKLFLSDWFIRSIVWTLSVHSLQISSHADKFQEAEPSTTLCMSLRGELVSNRCTSCIQPRSHKKSVRHQKIKYDTENPVLVFAGTCFEGIAYLGTTSKQNSDTNVPTPTSSSHLISDYQRVTKALRSICTVCVWPNGGRSLIVAQWATKEDQPIWFHHVHTP
eukprot:SAG11_NODE_371_length_10051_cov_5.987741_5_plen_174_part_00